MLRNPQDCQTDACQRIRDKFMRTVPRDETEALDLLLDLAYYLCGPCATRLGVIVRAKL